MSDSFRSDGSRALEGVPDADRVAKIEQLLIAGLDHYFAERYEQAINVWTRALFLDRSHPRARAYIDRARSALAEQQRQTEELLHTRVAQFDRSETAEAKPGRQRPDDAGGPQGDALRSPLQDPPGSSATRGPSRAGFGLLIASAIVAAMGVGAYEIAVRDGLDWSSMFDLHGVRPGAAATPVASGDGALPLPRRGEMMLARARALASGGRLREALSLLDTVWAADPKKPEVDRLRADLQRRLMASPGRPQSPAPVHDRDREPSHQP
jgi:tetratricopeptide (TPR) repeat protein